MPTLKLSTEQFLDAIGQLTGEDRRELLRRLLADVRWERLLAYGESRLDAELSKRGLNRATMTPDEIEATIERIADGE